MQRWKTLAPVEEVAPAPVVACACGAALSADWAYCARCGRAATAGGARPASRLPVVPVAIAAAVAVALAFLIGMMVGGGGRNSSGPAVAEAEVTRLRGALAGAERSAGQ